MLETGIHSEVFGSPREHSQAGTTGTLRASAVLPAAVSLLLFPRLSEAQSGGREPLHRFCPEGTFDLPRLSGDAKPRLQFRLFRRRIAFVPFVRTTTPAVWRI